MIIRDATIDDLSEINDIYNWHTENGFSTFGELQTLEQRTEWFDRFIESETNIALVAEDNGKITGVSCAFEFRGGGVFKNTLETSIYIHHEYMGKGIGSKLYEQIFEILEKKKIHRIVVGVALPNEGSVAIHKKFGFEEIGIFDEYAFYKGKYRSSIWLQKKMDA